MIRNILDKVQGKVPSGAKRSPQWPKVRKQHLEKHPECAACGGTTKLEVHHKMPFHFRPELELDPTNLITLCEGNKVVNCHLAFGHLASYKSYNKDVEADAAAWRAKVSTRPTNAQAEDADDDQDDSPAE